MLKKLSEICRKFIKFQFINKNLFNKVKKIKEICRNFIMFQLINKNLF